MLCVLPVSTTNAAAPPPLPPAAATLLGATLGDRLRINAKWALRGMHAQQGGGGGAGAAQPPFVGALQSRLARWRLALHVGLLRLAFWLSSAVHSATTYLVPVMQ